MSCPCGTGLPYDGCCGLLHSGGTAASAEALMRSRYSAFARGDAAYLLRSWHPSTRPQRLVLDPLQEWVSLAILQAHGGFLDTKGTVEFRASWRHGSATGVMHEHSTFVREDGHWLYVAGVTR